MSEPWIVSWSELDTFHQCPWKWGRLYRDRLVAPTTSKPLIRGTGWHRILEAHYLAIQAAQRKAPKPLLPGHALDIDPAALSRTVRDIAGEYDPETEGLLCWAYQGYLDQYGFDTQWQILAVEWRHELPLDLVVNERPVVLKLKSDLIVKDGFEHTWLIDHKMQANLPKGQELDLDDQFGLYTWAARRAGHEVFGSIHNSARSFKSKVGAFQPLDERFKRTLLNRTDTELESLAADARGTVLLMAALMAGVSGAEPRFTDPDRCRWRCPLTEPCLASRKGRNLDDVLDEFGFVHDPTRH